MRKYLINWYSLYIKLVMIQPSESYLHVRLDVKPLDSDSTKRDVRIRVASKMGPLIHDEIKTVIDLVDTFIGRYDMDIQTEIVNNGIEITSLSTFTGGGDEDEDNSIELSLTAAEFRALEMAFGHGEAALEAYEDEFDAVDAGKSVRALLDQFDTNKQGDAEDSENAKTWLNQGNVARAIKTAGPDSVAGWLAEASFGPDVRIALKDGRVGLITGFSDDQSGQASQGRFAVDIIDADEESAQYVPTDETVDVGIDDIAGVIAFDNFQYVRGGVEPLEWQD